MSANHILIWNARGLNSRARRSVVKDIVAQQRSSIVWLQESKVATFSVSMNIDVTGIDFDSISLPAIGIAGGAVVAWRHDMWNASLPCVRRFSVTVKLAALDGIGVPWWLTNVYGPTARADKATFLQSCALSEPTA
jgi:exonuclease III